MEKKASDKDIRISEEDEVAALLAGTDAAVDICKQSSYEEQVLLEATLKSAPQLPLLEAARALSPDDDLSNLTSNGPRVFGFPDLKSLCSLTMGDDAGRRKAGGKHKQMMYTSSNEISAVFKILSNIRSEIGRLRRSQNTSNSSSESAEELKLHMKLQILLTYLESDLKIHPENMPAYAKGSGALADENARFQPKLSHEVVKGSKVKNSADKRNRESQNGKVNEKATASQVLERIKRGLPIYSQSSSASFGKQALVDRQKNIEIKNSKRNSMMTLKLNMLNDSESKSDVRRLFDRRKRKRNERRLQAKERLQAVVDDDVAWDSTDDISECEFNDEEVTNNEQESVDSSIVVTCPICSLRFQLEDSQQNADAFLSDHMNKCQKRSGRVTRAHRRIAAGGSIITSEIVQKQIKPKKRKTNSTPIHLRKRRQAIDDMDDKCYDDRVYEWMTTGISSMRKMDEQEREELPGDALLAGGLVIPAWMNDRLFPYQRTALSWMWELHKQGAGGIVGDEMGLGAMASCRLLDSVLIIAPATILHHWLNELKVWAPGLRRILLHNSGEKDGYSRKANLHLFDGLEKWLRRARKYRVNEIIEEGDDENTDDVFCGSGYCVLTTYEQVRLCSDVYSNHLWSYVILDEGQKIRNPNADVTLTCKRLKTPHRLLLSGTPIQNNLLELWSLFDFIFPGRLGTLPIFEAEFADPIKRGGYSNASKMQVQLAYRCALVLRDLINPYMLRRQKKDIKEVGNMPGKTEQVLFCKLTRRQRSMYEAYLRSNEVKMIIAGNNKCFRSITILRKICNHPDLVCDLGEESYDSFFENGGEIDSDNDSDNDNTSLSSDVENRSGKLEILSKLLPLWKKQGHRVLIFSQTRQMLNIIQRFVVSCGMIFLRLDGNTNVGSRQDLIDRFNSNPNIFGMLLTTRTGGVGVNLTGADRIILFDPDWNPMTDAQARERAWRFGQKRSVTVYRLITAGTIEEKIYHRQIFKTALSQSVLQDPRQRRLFSQGDLKDLFTLKDESSSLEDRSSGITETGEVLGGGVVEPASLKSDSNEKAVADANENKDTLKAVLRSKGLAGIFDHDFATDPSARTGDELESEAQLVAKRAAAALRQSIRGRPKHLFEPTWTGSQDTKQQRFGGNVISARESGKIEDGGVSSVGLVSSQTSSSNSVLAKLREKRKILDIGGTSKTPKNERLRDVSTYAQLQQRIYDFLSKEEHKEGVSTEIILKEFSNSVSDQDAAIFKRLLNNAAQKFCGKWRLRRS